MKKIYSSYITLVFVLFFINSKFFFQLIQKSVSIEYFIYEAIVYLILFAFIVNLFSFSKILERIWLLILFAIALVSIYFVNTMGIVFDKQVIKNIFATNIYEAFELLGYTGIIYSFFVIISLYFIAKKLIFSLQSIGFKYYIFNFSFLLLLIFSLSNINKSYFNNFIKYDTQSIVPVGVLVSLFDFIRTYNRDKKIIKKNLSSEFKFIKKDTEPLVVVMVIGESVRADRLSLNGYNKQTTPLLLREKNIISFNNATSCDTSTLSSVPCMVSRLPKDKFSFPIKETSFVKIFRDFGFDTYWISKQDEANVIKTFCKEANECIDISNKKYDEAILPIYNKLLKKSKNHNILIVIHMIGSHFDYNSRVPNNFRKFTPICKKHYELCSKITLDNSYDNTIVYLDYILDNLIKPLKRKNAILIYSSDHGESLGEKQYGIFARFGHASPIMVAPKAQTNVPFIVWASDRFLQLHTINKNIKNISHDFIFHSILDCSGFSSKLLDKNLSFCK